MSDLIIESNKKPSIEEMVGLYVDAGWGKEEHYNYEMYENAFEKCDFICAYREDFLVGAVRLLTDNFHETYVNEFVVFKNCQGQGVGTALMEVLLDKFGHTDIYLSAPENTAEFFLNNGMKLQSGLINLSRRGDM